MRRKNTRMRSSELADRAFGKLRIAPHQRILRRGLSGTTHSIRWWETAVETLTLRHGRATA